MMRFVLAMVIVLACLRSCSVQEPGQEALVPVEFGLVCRSALTRSSVDESCIDKVQMLVFDAGTGTLEARGSGKSVLVPSGRLMSFYALANFDKLPFGEDVTEAKFLDALARMEHFSEDRIGMVAHGESVFKSSSTVSMTADRMVSKVGLDTLECAFMSTGNVVPEVILRKMFLTNVCTAEPFSLSPSASGPWANRMGLDRELSDTLRRYLVCEPESVIPSSAPFPVHRSLFCMPNPVSNKLTFENAPLWSPRNTRLVIEMSIDDRICYYPITIDRPMQSNCFYRIRRLKLMGMGSDNPDKPVSADSVTLEVTVSSWTDTVSQNVTV